jgi:hypothetical protein
LLISGEHVEGWNLRIVTVGCGIYESLLRNLRIVTQESTIRYFVLCTGMARTKQISKQTRTAEDGADGTDNVQGMAEKGEGYWKAKYLKNKESSKKFEDEAIRKNEQERARYSKTKRKLALAEDRWALAEDQLLNARSRLDDLKHHARDELDDSPPQEDDSPFQKKPRTLATMPASMIDLTDGKGALSLCLFYAYSASLSLSPYAYSMPALLGEMPFNDGLSPFPADGKGAYSMLILFYAYSMRILPLSLSLSPYAYSMLILCLFYAYSMLIRCFREGRT